MSCEAFFCVQHAGTDAAAARVLLTLYAQLQPAAYNTPDAYYIHCVAILLIFGLSCTAQGVLRFISAGTMLGGCKAAACQCCCVQHARCDAPEAAVSLAGQLLSGQLGPVHL
jgi:hypothetical protein